VSPSQTARTITYIRNQKTPLEEDIEEEFIELLDNHDIPCDRRYVFR